MLCGTCKKNVAIAISNCPIVLTSRRVYKSGTPVCADCGLSADCAKAHKHRPFKDLVK